MIVTCPRCGGTEYVPLDWHPIAHDQTGRLVSVIRIPRDLPHRCPPSPKEDQ